MTPIDRDVLRWAQEQLAARLNLQLQQVDGLDTKAGIFFAYASALAIASAAIGYRADGTYLGLAFLLASFTLATVALGFHLAALRIQSFKYAPSADGLRQASSFPGYTLDGLLPSLLEEQQQAIAENATVVRQKIEYIERGQRLMLVATSTLLLQALLATGGR